nr:radical SAM protein [Rhodanobacter glycinis]
MVGEYLVLGRNLIEDLVEHRLVSGTSLYDDLKSKHFIYDEDSQAALPLLGLKYRTKLTQASHFTGLHIFVVTLRCDYSCPYCQVSRQTDDKMAFDMSKETADRAVDMVFLSPNPSIKIEFQGGEPLLNFPLIQYIVGRAESLNETFKRDLRFVIATNLSFLTDEVIEFCSTHGVDLSTSLDGPASLHNKNRPRPGKNGHQLVVENIKRIQRRLGKHRVSALMTTTLESLSQVRVPA